jgi:hypothetical protein
MVYGSTVPPDLGSTWFYPSDDIDDIDKMISIFEDDVENIESLRYLKL